MNLLHTIVLGIVEGFTEFLPVSSTAHLIITERLLGLTDSEFLKSFTVIIQFGAVLAVVALYGKRLIRDSETNKRILVAFLPTAAIGFLLYKVLKNYLLGNASISLWVLGIGGIALILFEKWHKPERENIMDLRTMPYRKAFLIGCAQALAVVPGVSRSAATIVAALGLGIKRTEAIEFSFLLAFPTLLAAAGYDLLKSHATFSGNQTMTLIVGFIASFIFGIIGIRFLVNTLKRTSLALFGWYRIIVSTLFLIIL